MLSFSEKITFVIFTFNEERRIERVILNFKRFGQILVVDNESTDRTCEIAKQYGCNILVNKNQGWVEDGVTTQKVKDAVKSEWIYWGFADEMIDEKTINAILASIDSDRYDIVNIARKNYYYGQFCLEVSADRMNRIFRKNSIDFSQNKIHHFGREVLGARIHKLPMKYFVHHFISNTAKSYLSVMDRYTDIESAEGTLIPSIFRTVTSSAKMLVVNILLRRGYKAGVPSHFLLVQMVYYRFLLAMKLYEKNAGLDRDQIELMNDAHRDQLLKPFR